MQIFLIGQRVEGLATLNPPSPPVIPRGFDFQHYMYFRQIGGIGFFLGAPDVIEDVDTLSLLNRIETLRQSIGGRIEAAIDQPESGLARALMIGQRSSISEDDMEAIRAAGLAHMLAISGLHVGLFSGAIFFVLRFAGAAIPAIALKYPVKKYAAVLAMVAAFFYMWIAGATIPTQRAMITVAVVFTAILLDRSPISLRVVAFAACCVLLIFPESLMSASFQMSFAAVTVLIAFYDWTRPLWSAWARQAGMLRKAGLYFGGVASTTILATFATAPLTLFHFQALPIYGLIANIVCVPLLGFVIMPLAIVAFLLMPFGLEGLALLLMDYGLSVILALAHFVYGLDGAVLHVPAFAFSALVFFVMACLAVIVLRERLRIICVSFFAFCALLNFQWIQYDAFVSSRADLVLLDTGDPQLIASGARKSRFERENWQQALGDEGSVIMRFPREGVMEEKDYRLSCDIYACRFEMNGHRMSYLRVYDISLFRDECSWADIVISQDIYKRDCAAAYVVNRGDTKYKGVHAIDFDRRDVVFDHVAGLRGQRPWVQPVER